LCVERKQGKPPVFKKGKWKANRLPRLTHRPVPSKPLRRFDQLRVYH
jgi:hypothetical protein